MSARIRFFEKNKADLENTSCDIQITDAIADNNGQEFVNFMRDRKNYTAWMTTNSTDAALTQIDIDLGDTIQFDSIVLVGHNLKDYTIQYLAGVTYVDFNAAIGPTADTNSTSFYPFTSVLAQKIRIIVNGTQVANADKRIKQFIVTQAMGQFQGWPIIKSPEIDTQKRTNKMLSGKMRVLESLESFSCNLDVKNWRIQNDIDLVEAIYAKRAGVLMWINANDAAQFAMDIKGYRKEDIFLVRPTDNYTPELVSGIYTNGIKQNIQLAEVIS